LGASAFSFLFAQAAVGCCTTARGKAFKSLLTSFVEDFGPPDGAERDFRFG
jgi:hypothetical protein